MYCHISVVFKSTYIDYKLIGDLTATNTSSSKEQIRSKGVSVKTRT